MEHARMSGVEREHLTFYFCYRPELQCGLKSANGICYSFVFINIMNTVIFLYC